MPYASARPYLAAALLLGTACASAPPPAPAPAPIPRPLPVFTPPSPAPLVPKPLRLFCSETANPVAFADLHLPAGEEPVDVALTPRYVWVLFQPARLLRFDRAPGPARMEMKVGPPGEVWTGIDADPVDGSIWVVSQDFVFHSISPDLQMKTVRLQRKVRGKSGFARLLVARDALYAAPICGDYGVWRIDRRGKVLGTDFPIEHRADEVLDPDTMPCATARIERDQDGRILARAKGGKVFRAELSGAWTPVENELLRQIPEHRVRASHFGKKGREGEYYYAAGYLDSLFFWKGKPVFFAPANSEGVEFGAVAASFVLDVPAGQERRRLAANCGPTEPLLDVATDAQGYAGITPRHLFFGDFAGAPDLP